MHFQDQTFNQSIVALSHHYQHGFEEPLHQHRVSQLLHITSGVLRVYIEQQCWVIPPHRGLWIPTGIPHRLLAVGSVDVKTLFFDPLARADLPDVCGIFQVSSLLRELIISATDIEPPILPGTRDERLLELVLDELRTIHLVDFNVPLPYSSDLAQFCQRVQDRIEHPWSVSDAAALLQVSERTVSRKFHHETGLGFGEWLRRSRLLKSMELLAQGYSVIQTALAVGYDSPSAFTAMFKRRIGLAPTEYIP
ncbi:AraC family transcriptional regulator [Celerinatantimonas sp. YJH-8]|uniref:AraC family transcriptional regulator n=1 Tax=Celerinatantimonas sp. YJH-8 TaxID=3228714 RepID=UPI0038C6D9C6